jgi:aminopeptidase
VTDRSEENRRLAELVVGFGADVRPGEIVGVTAQLEMGPVVREVARAAYERGARWVDVLWWDPWVKRARLEHADESTLDYVPPWLGERLRWLGEEHASRIGFVGPDAAAAAGLDPARTARDQLPYVAELPQLINDRTTSWTATPYPNQSWAEQVYPGLAPEAALDRLWQELGHVCRLDEPDPVGAWQARFDELKEVAARLTERRFDAIRVTGPGTDLTIGLFRSSEWLASEFHTVDGKAHHPNLPSEEIFTTPDPERVDGRVTATRPLEFHGSHIDGIRMRFEGGRAVEIDADTGADALRSIAAKDDGAARLGELALVDGAGRIGPLGTVFHETLLDENAASHVALGNAYTFPVGDEAERARANVSGIHADFMIGSPEVAVDGVTLDGERVPLLRGGVWQL